MMKKVVKILASIVLYFSMTEIGVLAEENNDTQDTPQVVEEQAVADSHELTEASQTYTVDISDVELPDADELLAGYIQEQFDKELPGWTELTSESASPAYVIDGTNNMKVYRDLEQRVALVAAGQLTNTEFVIENLEALGITTAKGSGSTEDEALAQAFAGLDVSLHDVNNALLANHPYEMYWYDKSQASTMRYAYSYYFSNNVCYLEITRLTFEMKVASEFGNGTTITTDVGTLVSKAVNKAKSIVNANAAKSDYEKVVAYKEAICDLTSYNYDAADESTNTPFGNPWQMLWVFDENPSTKVVCEGYAKAFKYLSDLTANAGFSVITVSGQMNSGGHMWNIVKMPDRKNYLVDVTNSDAGTIGQNGGLFLNGYSSNSGNTYTFTPSGSSVQYTYYNDTIDYYGLSALTLSSSDYNSATVRNTVDLYVTGEYNYDYSMQVLDIVNQKRAEQSLPALRMDEDLYAGALIRAMEISLLFSHTRPNGSTYYSMPEFNGKCFGENIAVGQDTPVAVMNTWMNSSGHRGNILDADYTSIGVGCVVVNGYTYWVQNFGGSTPNVISPSGSETLTKRIDVIPVNVPLSTCNTTIAVNSSSKFTILGYNTFDYAAINLDSFNFTSSDPNVVRVSADGTMTGIGAGTATVMASHKVDSSYSVTATITVTDLNPVSSVSLNKNALTLDVGATETLRATVSPANANDQTVVWTSSKPSIATVNNRGTVTAVAPGTTTIKATSSNGKYAECTVTVRSPRAVEITRQPIDQYAVNGEKATVSVAATGDGLTYQWYLKNKTATKFSKSSVTSMTYSVTMSDTVDGRQLYCVVSDQYGNQATSDIATLYKYARLTVVTQPKDAMAVNGQKVSTSVTATGNGLSYQWYLKNKTATKFSKSSVTSMTYSTTMSDTVDGRQVYCMITDQYGNTVTSNTVTLSKYLLTITTQPQNVFVSNGQTASTSVTAKGDGLTYQWFIKNKTATKFSKSSVTKRTYSVTMSDTVNGRQLYCIVTDQYGNTVTSDTVTFSNLTFGIFSQPKDAYVENGQKATASVTAVGEGLTYQWYVKNKNATTFSKSSITKNTYSVTMSDTVDGRQVYCVVTNKNGAKVTSETVTLNKFIPLSITTQPKNVSVANGQKASATVVAKGSGLSYQWYVKNKNATTFTKSSIMKNTYSVTMSDTVNGRQIYCVITDVKGNTLKTTTVTLSKK